LGFAWNVLDTTSHKKLLASDNYPNTLQDSVAPISKVTIMHAPRLQTHGHLKSTQEPQTHLNMGELVIIVAPCHYYHNIRINLLPKHQLTDRVIKEQRRWCGILSRLLQWIHQPLHVLLSLYLAPTKWI
jgi:hypothetical protein